MSTCPSCQSITGQSTLSCPSCGQIVPLDPGTLIDRRYEILERLGAGGMGTVYRARDRDLDQGVAIKFIRMGAHSQAVARFKSEIRLARKVKHRNVCAVWQNGYEGEFAYIVMELIEGRTLRELVQEQGPLAWPRACDLALQAAQGLEAIHEAGVIHRDVKTSNLMLDRHGIVRLVDFGIAKGDPTQPGPDLTLDRITASDQVVGSPEYMSPEQIQGLPLDSRTDVYSFGIVLYELFTGRVPFRGPSAFDTMMAHVREAPPLDGTAATTIPPVVVPILRRALAKSRDDRYASMRALRKDLKRARPALDDFGMESGTYPSVATLAPGWRRAEIWAPAAGLILGLAALRVLSDSAPPPPSTVPPQPSPSPSTVSVGLPAVPPPTIAPEAPGSAPPPPPVRGQLYQSGEPDLVPPACMDCPTLDPPHLEGARLEGGVVRVELLVDEEGRVHQPRAMGTASKEVKAAAVDMVKGWKYRPATRQGVPGQMIVVVDVSFRRSPDGRR